MVKQMGPIPSTPSIQSSFGFSLIELMIVLVIMGILAGIVIPQYNSVVNNTRREDLHTTMLAFAQAMERRFTEVNTYQGAAVDGGGNPADSGPPAPNVFANQAPLETSTKHFDLTLTATPDSYVLFATPINTSPHAGDPIISLDSTGTKLSDPGKDGTFEIIGWD